MQSTHEPDTIKDENMCFKSTLNQQNLSLDLKQDAHFQDKFQTINY